MIDYKDKSKIEIAAELEELKERYNSISRIIESDSALRENERSKLAELINVSEDFISFSSDTPDYQKIAQIVLDLSGGKYLSFNVFNEDGVGFKTVAITGIKENIPKALSIVGFDVINKEWPHDPWRFEITKNQSITRFEHLHDLTREIIPKSIIDLVEKIFNLGETLIVTIAKEEKVLGDFTIFFTKGESLVNEGLVNLFAHQVGLFLDRNNVTKALKRSESLFRLLAENSTDMIARHGLDGSFLYVSPSCRTLLGWEPEELVGHQSLDFVHPEDKILVMGSLKEIVKKPSVSTVEFRILCKDGRYIWFETISRTIQNIDTDIVSEIHCSSRDITKRKVAETALLESRANLAAIIENTSSSIWLVNTSYELLYINSVFENAFYSSYGVFLKPGMNIINSIPPSIKEEWKSRYDRAFRNERFIFEEKFVFGDLALYFEISMNPIVVENEVIGASVFSRDISDRKQVEQELINAKDRAEESDRLKSAFLANMSHEIRTPMNGILGFAELLKEPDLSGEDQAKYIRIIEKSGARMVNIINDIIDISRIESGQMKVSFTPTNLNELTEYVYNFFKPEVEQKGMKIICLNSLSADESIVMTDREKIYAILINLVKNAIKYSDIGSIELGYVLKNDISNTVLEFFVKDTGIGIPKERHSAIFERFVQADISDKRALQGAGLGLAISKAFVEMLGGRIRVESEAGKGSAFYFTIPYSTKEIPDLSSESKFYPDSKRKEVNNLNILIAEDDEISRIFLSKSLKSFSRKILIAKTGDDAIDIVRSHCDIDMILMDIQMPGVDGYEAIRQIRRFNKKVYIITQTAFALSGDKEKAISAGSDAYISKPINIDDLHVIINKKFS